MAYKERFPRKYLVFVFSQPLYFVPHWAFISLHSPLAAGDFGPPSEKAGWEEKEIRKSACLSTGRKNGPLAGKRPLRREYSRKTFK